MSDLPFIGRNKILKRLRNRILTNNQHVAINGLPQIGKTRILEELKRTLLDREEPPFVILAVIHGYSFPETLREIYDVLREEDQYLNEETGFGVQLPEEPEFVENDDIAIKRLQEYLSEMSKKRKVIVMLDEFERVFDGSNSWTEQQYNGFVRKLVLNEALDGKVFWIVASRARLDNLLLKKNYAQRINPFVSVTITSFSASDMTKYFNCLVGIIKRALTKEEQLLLWKHCGRYPKLLTLVALDLQKQYLKGDVNVAVALRDAKTEFESHFEDVIDVIAKEEKTTMHSLSNLVRCYFNPTQDDKELKIRLRNLGYMEEYRLNDTLPMDNYPYSDMTVSPTFVYYLFKNYLKESKTCQGTKVAGINDPRVLLPGLIALLRRITRKELSVKYPGVDWNKKLLIEECVWRERNGQYREFEVSDENTISLKNSTLSSPEGRIVLTTPIHFITGSYARKCSGHTSSDTWLLDCISLKDQAAIILHFPEKFTKYFKDAFHTDLNDEKAIRMYNNTFTQLKKARDDYAHYHCYGLNAPSNLDRTTADNCKKLLCSIYTYIVDTVDEYDQWL